MLVETQVVSSNLPNGVIVLSPKPSLPSRVSEAPNCSLFPWASVAGRPRLTREGSRFGWCFDGRDSVSSGGKEHPLHHGKSFSVLLVYLAASYV